MSFLEWLEGEIRVEIDTLTNKTKIVEYYSQTFDSLSDTLKRNRKIVAINPSNRDFQENLRREYERSMSALTPLMRKIEATNKLIDQIVYELYGLTHDQIRIVERSI